MLNLKQQHLNSVTVIKSRVLLGCCLLFLSCSQEKIPVNARFLVDTHTHLHQENGDGHGDNWCITWAADDHQWTFMDDGFGWKPRDERINEHRMPGIGWSAHLWKIKGDYANQSVEWVQNQPDYTHPTKWFGFGIVSVNQTIYATLTYVGGKGKGWGRPFEGVKMIYTSDFGENWFLHDGRALDLSKDDGLAHSLDKEDNFFWKEDSLLITDQRDVTLMSYGLTSLFPVQCGKDNSLAKDDFIYWYSPDKKAYHLNLARVHKNHITDKSKWEYFKNWDGNKPVWTSQLSERGINLKFSDKEGDLEACWRGCQPSIVYNPGLDKYIMISWNEFKTAYWNFPRLHEELGVKQYALTMFYSDQPYGPWVNFFEDNDFKPGGRNYSIYNPQLSPKWISLDGSELVMIFTSRSSYGSVGDPNDYPRPEQTDYAFNTMKISLELE